MIGRVRRVAPFILHVIRVVGVAKKMLLGEARLVKLGKLRVVTAFPFCEVPDLVSYEHKTCHCNLLWPRCYVAQYQCGPTLFVRFERFWIDTIVAGYGRMLTSVGSAHGEKRPCRKPADRPSSHRMRARGWIRPSVEPRARRPLYYSPAKDVEATGYRVDLTIKDDELVK